MDRFLTQDSIVLFQTFLLAVTAPRFVDRGSQQHAKNLQVRVVVPANIHAVAIRPNHQTVQKLRSVLRSSFTL
jgi:hypothetical protein